MTVHFRGFPDFATRGWLPLCSRLAEPVRGETTTEAHRVTCNDCRRVLRMNPRLDVEDESESRHP